MFEIIPECYHDSYARVNSTMRLSTQLLYMVWILTFLCSATPLSSSGKTDASLTGTSIHSPTFIEPAENDEEKEDEDDAVEYAGEGDGEATDEEEEEEDASEEEKDSNKEPFSDFDDLEVLAKGILGSNDNKESVVPCFGTWWPSSGGYVYYYEDYGNGGNDNGDDGDEYGGDYGRRRRNRRARRRRRMRRNRAKRARSSKKAAKKKS